MKHFIINIFNESYLLSDFCKFIAKHNAGTFVYTLEDFANYIKSEKMKYTYAYKDLNFKFKNFTSGSGIAVYDKDMLICDIVLLDIIDYESIDNLLNKIINEDN